MTKKICYDCKVEIEDFVLETRQTRGGDGVVYAGDFTKETVHANRRECQAVKLQQKVAERRKRDPFFDAFHDKDGNQVVKFA